MENMNETKCAGGVCGGSCHGGCCGGHGCHGGKHHLVRMILKIIVVMLIFCAGYRLGSMTGFIKASYRLGMMDGYYNSDSNYNDSGITPPVQ